MDSKKKDKKGARTGAKTRNRMSSSEEPCLRVIGVIGERERIAMKELFKRNKESENRE